MLRLSAEVVPGPAARPATAGCALDMVAAGAASLSAVVTVDDDEDARSLDACLASLPPSVDDVLVVQAAGALSAARPGVRTWHRSLGRGDAHPRETASGQVSGEWVLHLRADEVLEGDLPLLLRRLAPSRADVVEVSVAGADGGREPRLVRRSSVRWVGAVGEVPVGARGQRLTGADFQPPVRLRRQRTARPGAPTAVTLPPAPGALSPDAGDCWSALEHARLWAEAGRPSEALRWLLVLVAATDDPSLVLQAVWVAGAPASGRSVRTPIDPAHDSIDEAASAFAHQAVAAGQPHLAAKALRTVIAHGTDTRVHAARSHISVDRASTTELLARVVHGLGRPYESALLLLRTSMLPDWPLELEAVLEAFDSAGCDFAELSGVVHPVAMESFERQAQDHPSPLTSRWLLRRAAAAPEDVERLLRGARAGAALDVRSALPWALLVRQRGAPESCPLRLMARGGVVDATQTRLAAHVLAACFGEDEPVLRLAAEVGPDGFDATRFHRELAALVTAAREGL